MGDYTKECIKVFLEHQGDLYDGIVAQSVREAREFLTENMAVELDSIEEVKEYLEEAGMDVTGMSDEEVAGQSEVFPTPSGRYLVVAS